MSERSYAQIRWQQDRLGLLLVNTDNDRFFVHADKFLALFERQDEFIVLKQRDRRPGRAIGYYAGQVFGTLDLTGDEYCITLYIGNPYDDIVFNQEKGQPTAYLLAQTYTFPRTELSEYRDVMVTMLAQKDAFNHALNAAEITPLKQYHRERQTN